MKLASLVFGDNPKKADSNKLSSPQPGQIVRTADGSTYRVASKLAGPDGTVLKLANLQGKPVPTPANFHPVGSAMTRFASWLRYHLAYNADFDLYINSYIDRYNEQHPKQPLPYAIGPDGRPFRWADWFKNNINPRLNVPGNPSSDSVEEAKDELVHEMLITTLGHRNILEDFRKKLPAFMTKNDKVKNLELGRQLTHFLVKSFQYRIEEMNNKYKEKHPAEEVSMYQPAEENEEGLTEVNILDSEEHGVGEEEFTSAEARNDVAKFSKGFRAWLGGTYGEKAAESFGLMFDIFWRMLSQEGGSEIKRGELEQEWMQKTGLSFGSFKDYFARLPEVIEQYITSQEIEMGDQNMFVDLMNVIKKERTKRLRQERRQKEKARPAMVSSLHIAGIEGDIAEAIGETVAPATVDKDIKQPTVSVPEAAKVGSLYQILADSLAPNERMVTPEQAQVYVDSILPGDRVTILVPAGRGMHGQEWSESTGKAVMRSAHGGWVLNMGGRHGTPGIADVRNIVSVRPAKRASYLKMARLLPGDELTPEMIKQVKDAFIYRWTSDNEKRVPTYLSQMGGECPKCDIRNPYVNTSSAEGHRHPTIPLQNDDQWLAEHAFYFLNDGRLDHRHRNAEPVYLAQRDQNILSGRTAALEFAIDKSLRTAEAATPGGQLPCCGGWHNRHKSDCSVYNENFDKTIDTLQSMGKNSMLGHDFRDADGQAITNETESDTGRSPHDWTKNGAENRQCLDCGYEGSMRTDGSCEACGSSAVTPIAPVPTQPRQGIGKERLVPDWKTRYQEPQQPVMAAGSNSGKDDARGAGDLWRENFYENNESGPSAKALFGADKTAQGSGGSTVTFQNQNVTTPNTPGRGEPMAVPEAIDQSAGPHSPNAPATAPRTPGIQPKIVNVPAGTEGEMGQTVEASCSKCGSAHVEIDAKTAGYDVWCDDCEAVTSSHHEAAAAAAPVVSPNVEQQMNLVRPQVPAAGPGGTNVAIMPGGEEDPGTLRRHTVEPELPNAKYHMMSAQEELVASEEERLMTAAFGDLKQCKECGKIDPSVEVYDDGTFCTDCASGIAAE